MGKLVGLLLTLLSLGGLLWVMTHQRTATMPALSAEGVRLDAGAVPLSGVQKRIEDDLAKTEAARQAREDELLKKVQKESQ